MTLSGNTKDREGAMEANRIRQVWRSAGTVEALLAAVVLLVMGCQPDLVTARPASLVVVQAVEPTIVTTSATQLSPATIVVAYNGATGFDWSFRTAAGTWTNCDAATPGCTNDSGSTGLILPALSTAYANQTSWKGDPVLARDPSGNGTVTLVTMGLSAKSQAGNADLIVVGFSSDNGQHFGRVLPVNDRFFPFSPLLGAGADQPSVDIDANHTMCVTWRERGGDLDMHHPVIRCGTINSDQTVSWFWNGDNIPNASYALQDPGGMIVQMVTHPTSGTSHAAVVYSTPFLGDWNSSNTGCPAGPSGVRLYMSMADVRPGTTTFSNGSTEVAAQLITDIPSFQFCPNGIATQTRLFGFAYDEWSDRYYVAVPSADSASINIYGSNALGGFATPQFWFPFGTISTGQPGDLHYFPNLAGDHLGHLGLSFYAGSAPNAVRRYATAFQFSPSTGSPRWLSPVSISALMIANPTNTFARIFGDYEGLAPIVDPAMQSALQATFVAAWTDTSVAPPGSSDIFAAPFQVTP